MTAELMLINPRRKARRAKVRRNPRRRKMTALQRKYFGKGHGRVTRRRRSRTRTVTVARSNPVRRHRKRTYRRRRTIHVRRNPLPSTRGIASTLTNAAVGAAGAVGLNYAWQKLAPSLPSSLQSGITGSVAQIGGAIALGYLGGMAFGKSVGQEIAVGAVTVALFNIATSYMNTGGLGGGLALGGSGYGGAYGGLLAAYSGGGAYSGAGSYGALAGLGRQRARRMGRYVGTMKGMGRYVGTMKGLAMRRARLRGLGYVGPARTSRPAFRKA